MTDRPSTSRDILHPTGVGPITDHLNAVYDSADHRSTERRYEYIDTFSGGTFFANAAHPDTVHMTDANNHPIGLPVSRADFELSVEMGIVIPFERQPDPITPIGRQLRLRNGHPPLAASR